MNRTFPQSTCQNRLRDCLLKLFSLQAQLQRQARREEDSLLEANLPRLWILTTSASTPLLDSLGAKIDPNNGSSGVYLTPDTYKTGIVAINQLPLIPDTLTLEVVPTGIVRSF